MSLKRYYGCLGAVFLALLAFQARASANGTASGSTISNVATIKWNVSGTGQDTTAPSADTSVRVIAGDTLTDITSLSLAVGETKVFTYSILNSGNRADTFKIEVDSFSLNNGAVSWTFTLYVDGTKTSLLADTLTTAATVAADAIKQCSVAIWSNSTPANSPDLSRADFRLKIYQGNVNTADSTGQYTGDNGTTYATGSAGGQDFASALLAAAKLTLAKAVTSVKIGGAASAPLPGATILYTLTYNNIGSASADSVVLIDTVPANTTFDTASSSMSNLGASATFADDSGSSGFTCQVTTSASPNQAYVSTDWNNLTNYSAGTVRGVRWIRQSVAAAQTATVRFRVIIQ